jgi:hypothetical protein
MFPCGFLKWKQKKTPGNKRKKNTLWRFLERVCKTKHYALILKIDVFLENSLAYFLFLDIYKCPKIFSHGVFCFHFSILPIKVKKIDWFLAMYFFSSLFRNLFN